MAWAGIGGLWWLAGAILWLNHKHKRRQHRVTHRALRLSVRSHLSSEIDPETYSNAMLRAARNCLGYLAALVLIIVGLWFASTLVAK